jgi:hypothetical protein
MEWWQWLILAALILLLLLLLLLLALWAKKRIEEMLYGGSDEADGYGDGEDGEEDEYGFRESAERARETRESRAKQILESGDKDVINLMLNQAGLGQETLKDRSHEADLVRKIAERLDNVDLAVLSTAANQNDIEIDLKESSERIPVDYPTSDMEPTAMTDLDQLREAGYEDIVGDSFFEDAALGDLQVMQSYETVVTQKLLYILMDVSGSMQEQMRSGKPRHIWSRAIGVSLMLDALRGNAKYFLRFFDGRPLDLIQVTTPEESKRATSIILNTGLTMGGTDIPRALAQAANDINNNAGDIAKSEVLLITDGEDDKMTASDLRRLLGANIRLHVLIIGSRSPVLKEVATTYKEYQ